MLKLLGAYFHQSHSRIFQLVPSENQKRYRNVNRKGLHRGRFYPAERRDIAIQLHWTQTRSSLGLCTKPCTDPSTLWIKMPLCPTQPWKVSACLLVTCTAWIQSQGRAWSSLVLQTPPGFTVATSHLIPCSSARRCKVLKEVSERAGSTGQGALPRNISICSHPLSICQGAWHTASCATGVKKAKYFNVLAETSTNNASYIC